MSSFKKATREKTTILIGVAGPSGSGKTYSAMRLATGLANGGKIFVIDSEARRALHYSDQFEFMHADFSPPFGVERYLAILQEAKDAGAAVVVVDSMTHAHDGPGGMLEQHEAELDKMAGTDWKKREKVKFTAWIKPKKKHNEFVDGVLRLGIHVVFCFRAREKLKMVKVDGKTEPVNIGWQPICSSNFEYEQIALLMLPPGSKGIPDMTPGTSKFQDQHLHLFPAGEQISEEMGKRLAEWAAGGGKVKAEPDKPSSKPNKKLALLTPDGAVTGEFAKASEWLDGLKAALLAADEGKPAGQVWDVNAETYASIQTSVESMKDGGGKTAARDLIAAVGTLAHERTKIFAGGTPAVPKQESFVDQFTSGNG